MHHVFLSHSSKDHDAVISLYSDLVSLGFQVWFDEVALEPSDSLIAKIGSAIRSSMNLAVVLSTDSVASRWVEKEVSIALTGQLAGSNVNVVPIRIDDAELPPFLSDIKYVDFRKSAEDKRPLEFARLVKKLLSSLGKDGGRLRLVSGDAYASATDQHNHRFGPAHVLIPSPEDKRDDPRTYWLTTNDTKATISLKLARAYPTRLLRILNTRNGARGDRAATLASVDFTSQENELLAVWKGSVPVYPNWLTLWFDSVYASAVHVNVEDYHGRGGGLNCIEVYTED